MTERATSLPLPESVLKLEHAALKEEALERLKMQESLAQACFRSLVLVNGGAVIALFTLIGSNAEVAKQVSGLTLWIAFGAFAAGLTATILGNVAGFFMQIHYAMMTTREMWNKEFELAGLDPTHDTAACLKAGDRWEKVAIASVIAALVLFIVGSALCFFAFLR